MNNFDKYQKNFRTKFSFYNYIRKKAIIICIIKATFRRVTKKLFSPIKSFLFHILILAGWSKQANTGRCDRSRLKQTIRLELTIYNTITFTFKYIQVMVIIYVYYVVSNICISLVLYHIEGLDTVQQHYQRQQENHNECNMLHY